MRPKNSSTEQSDRHSSGGSRLFVYTVCLSAGSIVAILSLFGITQYRDLRDLVIRNAKVDSVHIAATLRSVEIEPAIRRSSQGLELFLSDRGEFGAFDAHLRQILAECDVVKIKFFDRSTRIVYSTDRAIIGKRNPNNANLRRALRGEVVELYKHKEAFTDLADEQRLDVDVVETYIPIFDDDGTIIGAVEIYEDITDYLGQAQANTMRSIVILGAMLAAVFSFLCVLMWRASRAISLRTFELESVNRELINANKRLNYFAVTDELTGLLNRRAVMTLLMRLWTHAGGPYESITCILVDVDHFKDVNDSHGHAVGDLVLRSVARRLNTEVGERETVCRLGGEEFLVICPGMQIEMAAAMAQRMRKAFEAPEAGRDHDVPAVTVSIGVAARSAEMKDPDDLLREADEAMFSAKRAGRNCVRLATTTASAVESDTAA